MQILFSRKSNWSSKDQIQSRLLIMAAVILIIYAFIRTLAPMIRQQSNVPTYQFDHWLGLLIWGIAFAVLNYQSARKLPQRDPYLLPIIALLTGLGQMTIWRLYPAFGLRQSIWIALSALLFFAGLTFPAYLDYIRKYKYIWLVSGLILTALTIFIGRNPSGSGPKLWLAFFGVHIQPSELLKLLLIAYLAAYFTDRLSIAQGKLETLLPSLLVTSMALLLLIFQRDLGSAIIFLLIYLAMLFTSRGNKIILWIAPLIITIAGVLGYFFIDVVRLRIDTWINPFSDPAGASYQIIQSMIAIAEGALMGAGPGLGNPNLVPVSLSDFVYSAIAEELGFLGTSLVIILLIILIYRGIKLAISTPNSFYRYLSLGIVFYIGIQSVLIIGGNIGLLPLTGVTLPFVSYGGSSLIVSFCAAMILLSISQQVPEPSSTQPGQLPRFAIFSALIIVALIIEILATSLISFWFRPTVVARADNPRWIIDDRLRPRGDILDRNNQIIITNTDQSGSFQRSSKHVPLSPIIGYTNAVYGQTGIEASMFPYLRGTEGYTFATRFWEELLYNLPPEGLDIRLTIQLEMQKQVDTLFEDNLKDDIPGAAIIMNAQTGEILAMASHPYFDATQLETEWDDLLENENAPLVNRVTQGLYPPGGGLLPFIAASQVDLLQDNPDPTTLFTNLKQDLQCALDLEAAPSWSNLVSNGCKGVQGELGEISGTGTLLEFYQAFGFFSEPELRLNVAAVNPITYNDEITIFQGQDGFTISPLQMALAASALTNKGIVPSPRIVNGYQDPSGCWITLPKLSENYQAIPEDTASQTINLIQQPSKAFWQITATSTTENEAPITWFIAGTGTTWSGQPTTIVLVLEAEEPALAQQIGKVIIEEALQLGKSGN